MTMQRPRTEFSDADVVMVFERRGQLVHVATHGMTNHEMRAVLVGFWLRLDAEDREDHINELRHYLLPSSQPSPLSRAIASSENDLHPTTEPI